MLALQLLLEIRFNQQFIFFLFFILPCIARVLEMEPAAVKCIHRRKHELY